jgi:pimeloyl-ACP methyl ester carboxylesterase
MRRISASLSFSAAIASAIAAFLLEGGAMAAPESAAPPAVLAPEIAREYARPHDRIDVGGGRHLNLFCMGSGDATVLFEAGGSDWSVIWALVQPAIASQARACAYDRAGLGYSDPARMPRSPVAIVEDLRALIVAAGLKRPLVLVGHSLGGFNVKLYAALCPEDVAGLVLVDPAEERSGERTRALLRSEYGRAFAARSELRDISVFRGIVDRYRNCAGLARNRPLDPETLDYRRCSDPVRTPLGREIAAERRRIQVTAAYQEAQASEIANSVYGDSQTDGIYADLFRPRMFGDKPMVVLTHGLHDASDPLDSAGFKAGLALHAESARLSTRGAHRVVPGSSHNIEIDAPGAVVDAVRDVLRQLK